MPNLPLNVLNSISIASPCAARWEEMSGDDRTRHCAQCGLDVHNFEAMSAPEIERVLQVKLDDPMARVCVRMFRRADGTILTQDCPRGLAAARVRVRRSVARIAAAVGLMTAAGAAAYASRPPEWSPGRLREVQPFAWICSKIAPGAPVRSRMAVMGDMCVRPAPAPTAAPGPQAAGR